VKSISNKNKLNCNTTTVAIRTGPISIFRETQKRATATKHKESMKIKRTHKNHNFDCSVKKEPKNLQTQEFVIANTNCLPS
jgi:hypothetical protein